MRGGTDHQAQWQPSLNATNVMGPVHELSRVPIHVHALVGLHQLGPDMRLQLQDGLQVGHFELPHKAQGVRPAQEQCRVSAWAV